MEKNSNGMISNIDDVIETFSIQYLSELIYRDDEMYQLYQDCSKEIRKYFSKEELREISLNLLGV